MMRQLTVSQSCWLPPPSGTHHLPTWVEPLAQWSHYHSVGFSLTNILGRWFLISQTLLRHNMCFLKNFWSFLVLASCFWVIQIFSWIRWCFIRSLSSPLHGSKTHDISKLICWLELFFTHFRGVYSGLHWLLIFQRNIPGFLQRLVLEISFTRRGII